MAGRIDWDPIRELAGRVLEKGEALILTDDVRALFLRTAQEVAIEPSEVAAAFQSVESATALLVKMRERIREGSNRLVRALYKMQRLRDAGDLDGARQALREHLSAEVIPHHREIVERELAKLDGLAH